MQNIQEGEVPQSLKLILNPNGLLNFQIKKVIFLVDLGLIT